MVQSLIESISGYPGLWLVCATSGVLVPVPEDVPLLYAGSRIAEGSWGWAGTLIVATSGVAVRDVGSWAFGRVLGRWLLDNPRFERLLASRKIARARAFVGRHGTASVLLGRFMVGFRAPVFVAAGAMGVPLRSFVSVDALGLALAVPLAVGLGFVFGDPIAELAAVVLQRSTLVATVLAVAGLGWVAWRAVRARRPALDRERSWFVRRPAATARAIAVAADPDDEEDEV